MLAKCSVKEEIEVIGEEKEKILVLQGELECKQDLIMQEESKTDEIFSDYYRKKLNALYELDLKGEKLVKLGVSKSRIGKVKE